MKRIVWFSLGCLALVTTAQAASFDCGKATSKVENLICSSHELSKLDDDLSRTFQERTHQSNNEQKPRLVLQQKQWLKQSRNVCSDEPCLNNAYRARIAELDAFIASNLSSQNRASGDINTIDLKTSDDIYLTEKHLIVSKTCASDNGVYMNVYDRATYQPLESIRIEDCDEEYQDGVNNIAYQNGKYYLLMTYRYAEEASSNSRLKLVIVDAKTWKITKTYTAADVNKSDFVPSEKEFPNTIFPLNDNAHEVRLERSDRPYVLTVSLVEKNSNISRELFRAETWHQEGNKVTLANTFSNLVVIGNILAIGMNRDLYVIDVQNSKYKVIHEYQKNGFSDNGFGVDRNKINSLLFDELTDRLLIFCFNGVENSFLSVDELKSMPNIPLQGLLPVNASQHQ